MFILFKNLENQFKEFYVELQADNTAILVFFFFEMAFIYLFCTERDGALHVAADLQVLYCVGSFLQHLISLTSLLRQLAQKMSALTFLLHSI